MFPCVGGERVGVWVWMGLWRRGGTWTWVCREGRHPLGHAPCSSPPCPTASRVSRCKKCGAQPLRRLAPPSVGPNSVPCPFLLAWGLQVHEGMAGLVARVLAAWPWATTSRAAVPCRLHARTAPGLEAGCKKDPFAEARWDGMARLIAVRALSPYRPIVLRGLG